MSDDSTVPKMKLGWGGLKEHGPGDPMEDPVDEIPIPPRNDTGEVTEYTRSLSGGVGPPILDDEAMEEAERRIDNIEKKKWWEGHQPTNNGRPVPTPLSWEDISSLMDSRADAKELYEHLASLPDPKRFTRDTGKLTNLPWFRELHMRYFDALAKNLDTFRPPRHLYHAEGHATYAFRHALFHAIMENAPS